MKLAEMTMRSVTEITKYTSTPRRSSGGCCEQGHDLRCSWTSDFGFPRRTMLYGGCSNWSLVQWRAIFFRAGRTEQHVCITNSTWTTHAHYKFYINNTYALQILHEQHVALQILHEQHVCIANSTWIQQFASAHQQALFGTRFRTKRIMYTAAPRHC